MNKKKTAISAGFCFALLATTGCSGESYEYLVSGTVQDGGIDWDCKNELGMEPMALALGGHQKTGASRRPGAASTPRQASTSKPPARASKSASPRRSTGGAGASSKPSPPSTKMPRTRSNKGVQLSRKPDKPHRIAHIPVVHGTRPSGCKVDDYELYIMSNGDLYEQDVRAADYHACLEQALMMFPLCTTNDVE